MWHQFNTKNSTQITNNISNFKLSISSVYLFTQLLLDGGPIRFDKIKTILTRILLLRTFAAKKMGGHRARFRDKVHC